MGKLKMSNSLTCSITEAQRTAQETEYRIGKSHALRLRCQMILLKAVSVIFGMSKLSALIANE